LPRLAKPEGDPNFLTLPMIESLQGKRLASKMQEAAAWKAFVDYELGIATSMYVIIATEKRLSGNTKDVQRGYAFAQAYMKRLEKMSDALKTLYDGYSRQLSYRDIDAKIQGSRRLT